MRFEDRQGVANELRIALQIGSSQVLLDEDEQPPEPLGQLGIRVGGDSRQDFVDALAAAIEGQKRGLDVFFFQCRLRLPGETDGRIVTIRCSRSGEAVNTCVSR